VTSIRRWLARGPAGGACRGGARGRSGDVFLGADESTRCSTKSCARRSLSLRDHAVLDLRRSRVLPPTPTSECWCRSGTRVGSSYASRIVGTRSDATHRRRLCHAGARRSFVGAAFTLFTGRATDPVAQPTALRTELAARTAWRLLVPVLFMLPFSGSPAGGCRTWPGAARPHREAVKERSPTALTPFRTTACRRKSGRSRIH